MPTRDVSNWSGTRCRALAAAALGCLLLPPSAALATSPSATVPPPLSRGPGEAPLGLPGQGGGSLGSLTVEGDSAVRIRFERPALNVDLDPLAAPGLEPGATVSTLDRVVPDLARPLLAASTAERATRTPRPWLATLATGSLSRLRPDLKGVARWQVEIVDSGGIVVATREGDGAPPREIPWDGLRNDGEPAPAGVACSHVMTARDKAGNTRRFVGDSFVVPPYRVETPAGPCILFSAGQWRDSFGEGGISPLLVEVATVLNLRVDAGREVVVRVAAATAEEADETGREVIAALAPRIGGAAGRLSLEPVVSPGSPPGGTVRVAARSWQ